MPRQTARLVFGRSAKARLTPSGPLSRQRPFSTTQSRRDDDAKKSPRSPRARSAAAASALGAMSNNTSKERPLVRRTFDARKPEPSRTSTLSKPPGLGQRSNVISIDSLPRRADGTSRPFIHRSPQTDGQGGSRPPGSSGFAPRFAGRPAGGNIVRPPPAWRFGKPGGNRPGGQRGRAPGGGKGGAQGSGKGKPPPKKKKDAAREFYFKPETEAQIFASWDESLQQYITDHAAGGKDTEYKPSTTLESLIGWGPAVATNTMLGQAEIAVRNLRLVGGGKGFEERESTMELLDVERALSSGTPIYYSSMTQKKAVHMMLHPDKVERAVEKQHEQLVARLQKTHGENYAAFVAAYNQLGGEQEIKSKLREAAERSLNAVVEDRELLRTKNKTTTEAISKFAVKGDHPPVKQAEDLWGKLAMYAAHERSYRPADGARLEQKVRSLVKA